jgi:hypothetical protein
VCKSPTTIPRRTMCRPLLSIVRCCRVILFLAPASACCLFWGCCCLAPCTQQQVPNATQTSVAMFWLYKCPRASHSNIALECACIAEDFDVVTTSPMAWSSMLPIKIAWQILTLSDRKQHMWLFSSALSRVDTLDTVLHGVFALLAAAPCSTFG